MSKNKDYSKSNIWRINMTISDIYFALKTAYRKKNFIPVTEGNYKSIEERLQSNSIVSKFKVSFTELQAILKEHNLHIENLYYVERAVSPFCYREGLVFIDLSTDLDDTIKKNNYRDNIDYMNQMFDELISISDFESLLIYIDSKYRFWVFMEILPRVPEEMVYSLFRKVYTEGYSGFDESDWEQARKILKTNKDRTVIEPLKTDEEGYVTIYRGVGSKSSPLDKTFSWTISLNVAIKFAMMYGSLSGQVYKAKVKKENIHDFLQERDEEEVLIFPENVVDIEDLGLLNFNKQFRDELDNAGVIEEYNEMTQFIIPQLFKKPDGIHGVLHAKRVLFLTLIQSYLLKLPKEQKRILAWCAVFHDIGRKNDEKDSNHGILSMKKLQDKDLLDGLSKRIGANGLKTLKYILENHAVSDVVGIKKISKYGIKDVEIAKELYFLFKDSDGLDRCRLGDLNINYLRNDISMKLVLVAGQILQGIK
jgi:hypothetical protein